MTFSEGAKLSHWDSRRVKILHVALIIPTCLRIPGNTLNGKVIKIKVFWRVPMTLKYCPFDHRPWTFVTPHQEYCTYQESLMDTCWFTSTELGDAWSSVIIESAKETSRDCGSRCTCHSNKGVGEGDRQQCLLNSMLSTDNFVKVPGNFNNVFNDSCDDQISQVLKKINYHWHSAFQPSSLPGIYNPAPLSIGVVVYFCCGNFFKTRLENLENGRWRRTHQPLIGSWTQH